MKKRLRRDGHVYSVSPYYLVWIGEELFMLANPDSHGNLTHFRAAMLTAVEVSDERRKNRDEVLQLAQGFDLNEYVRKSVNMYTGESVKINLRCHISLLDAVIAKFSRYLQISNTGEEHFSVSVTAADNDGIYQLITQYGGKIEVLSPAHVRKEVKNRLFAALSQYENEG